MTFVLGQMEDKASQEALVRCLEKEEEHQMVRHEAAIALGAVGTVAAEEALLRYAQHPLPMVAESCLVARATLLYWRQWEELEARLKAAD